MTVLYWFFIAVAILFLVALLRGTVRDAKMNSRNSDSEDIGEVNKKIKKQLMKIRSKSRR